MLADSVPSFTTKKKIEALLGKIQQKLPLNETDIIDLTQKDLDLFYSMAHTFYSAGQYTKALPLFHKLILSRPFAAPYWRGAGAALQMLQEPQEALVYYGVAALLAPKDPLIHLYAAQVLIDLGRTEEARGAIVHAESLAPEDDIDFKAELESLYERIGD